MIPYIIGTYVKIRIPIICNSLVDRNHLHYQLLCQIYIVNSKSHRAHWNSRARNIYYITVYLHTIVVIIEHTRNYILTALDSSKQNVHSYNILYINRLFVMIKTVQSVGKMTYYCILLFHTAVVANRFNEDARHLRGILFRVYSSWCYTHTR